MSFYDPYRTRQNHQRKYTRKGQVLQAKLVDQPRTIDRTSLRMYRDFFLQNPQYGLAPSSTSSFSPYKVTGIHVNIANQFNFHYKWSQFDKETTVTDEDFISFTVSMYTNSLIFSYIITPSGFYINSFGINNTSSNNLQVSLYVPGEIIQTKPITVHSKIFNMPTPGFYEYYFRFDYSDNKPDPEPFFTSICQPDETVPDWTFIPNSLFNLL